MDSLQAIDKIRGQGVKVYVNSPTEKEAFRKQSQGAVIDYIAGEVGKPLVDRLLAAVEEAKKQAYAN